MRIFTLALILALSLPCQSKQAETLVFNTFLIPLMVESEDKGVFIELTRELAKRVKVDIKINILPAKRSINDFVHGKADALFPALANFFPSRESYHRTDEIIYIKRDFSFSLKDSPKLNTIEALAGRKVSITRGYIYAEQLVNNRKIQFYTANSDEFAAKMLEAGHVDAFIAEEQSGLAALSNIGLVDKVKYDQATAISELDVFYATLAGNKGQRLAQRLSKGLKEMKENGSFQRILAKSHGQ